MSDTPETPLQMAELERERDEATRQLASVRKELVAASRGAETNAKVNQGLCARLTEAERERDEARRELLEIISCIEQAVDFHQVHHQSFQASAVRNLLENINRRRKRNE
jgi:predicted  nucleic acid-binding Zn-ribbon protein